MLIFIWRENHFPGLTIFLIFCFLTVGFAPAAFSHASPYAANALNEFLPLSAKSTPVSLIGLKLNPGNPLDFNFLLESGTGKPTSQQLKAEAQKSAEYFLAALAIPEKDLWVNLSPLEKDRIIPDTLSVTRMGADMLGQDYFLKRLAASLTYPETESGKKYWAGMNNGQIQSMNKVWIVPDKAVVYESNDRAIISKAHLKAMVEDNNGSAAFKKNILPAIEEEVNNGANFAQLRQMYHALLLAVWFKRKLKESIYKNYLGSNKVEGVRFGAGDVKEKIYHRYLDLFKKGVYDYIKKDFNASAHRYTKRRYYCGGVAFDQAAESTEFYAMADAALTDQPVYEAWAMAGPVGQAPQVYDEAKALEFSREFEAQMEAKFGRLADDHPLTVYVRQALENVFGAKAKKCRIFIAPGWNAMNATALPNGTIIVSRGILNFVRYRQELEGLLAHEFIHIDQEHGRYGAYHPPEGDFDPVAYAKEYFRSVSIRRFEEMEGDMAWLINAFQENGVNPFGYLTLLNRWEHLEEGRELMAHDISHGTKQQRALVMERLFYTVDFAALREELDEIPEDVRQQIHLVNIRKNFPSTYDGRALFTDGFDLNDYPAWERYQNRVATALNILAPEHLGLALSDWLEQRHRQVKDERIMGERKAFYENILKAIHERIDREIFDTRDWPDANKRRLARIFYYALHGESKVYSGEDAAAFAALLEDKDFLALMRVVLQYDRSAFILEAAKKIIISALAQKEVTPEAVTAACAEVDRLFRAFAGFSARYSRHPFERDDCVRKFMRYLRQSLLIERDDLSAAVNVAATEHGWINNGNKIDGLSEHVDTVKTVEEDIIAGHRALLPEGLRSAVDDIAKRCKGARQYLFGDYGDIFERLKKASLNMPQDEILTLFFHLAQAMPNTRAGRAGHYVVFRLFERAFDEWRQFKGESSSVRGAWCFRGFVEMCTGNYVDNNFKGPILSKQGNRLVIVEPSGEDYQSYSYFDMTNTNTEEGWVVSDKSCLSPADSRYTREMATQAPGEIIAAEYTRADIVNDYKAFSFVGREGKLYLPELLDGLFTRILIGYLARLHDWSDIFREIEVLEAQGVPVKAILEDNNHLIGYLVALLVPQMPVDPRGAEILRIGVLSKWIIQPFLRMQLKSYIDSQLLRGEDFSAQLDAVLPPDEAVNLDAALFDKFTEEHVNGQAAWEKVRARLSVKRVGALDQGSIGLGGWFFVEGANLSSDNYRDLTMALLESGESDQKLKDILLRLADNNITLFNLASHGSVHVDIDETPAEKLRRAEIEDKVLMADLGARSFTGLSAAGRYAFLAKALTGRNGLVSTAKERSGFMRELLTRVTQNDSKSALKDIFSDVIKACEFIDDWRPVYYALNAILVNRIGIPPREPTPWEEVNFLQTLMQNEGFKKLTVLDKHLIGEFTGDSKAQEKFWLYAPEWVKRAEDLLSARLTELGAAEFAAGDRERMSDTEFAVEFAQNSGALFVRFLQLLPQFVDMPDEFQGRFSRVYDAMHGQNKLAAILLLEREWNKALRDAGQAAPGFWDEIETIGKRVGGGSLMTVYRTRAKSGDDEVVKVLNPNLLFNLRRSVKLVSQVIDKLVEKHGEKYAIARLVVDEVQEWLERDVNFEGFLEKDARFKATNDNFGVDEGYSYRMYVPKSRGPASKYFIREEYIEGKNLTDWDGLAADGHDMKEIISLMVHNYMHQLENGLVHSDVHVGNFRITPDKRIAILDRNFFLELESKPQVKAFVEAMFGLVGQAIASGGSEFDAKEAAQRLVAISGAQIAQDKMANIVEALEKCAKAIAKKDFSAVGKMLIALRANGIKLPLEVTLMFKNIGALNQMARRAGFDSLIEAFLYQPKGPKGPSSEPPPSGPVDADNGGLDFNCVSLTTAGEGKFFFKNDSGIDWKNIPGLSINVGIVTPVRLREWVKAK